MASKYGKIAGKLLSAPSALLAIYLLFTEFFPSLGLPAPHLVLLAELSLLLTTLQAVLRRLRGPANLKSLLTFLPAVPVAIYAVYGIELEISVHLIVATAFAFQARIWLLAFANSRQDIRDEWAKMLEERISVNATVFVDNDIESEVTTGSLREGHTFRLAAGQVVPADGVVTFGSGFVDETLLDGQPERLELKGMGSLVYAGTTNRNGSLLVRTSSVGDRTFSYLLAHRLRHGSELVLQRILSVDAMGIALAGANFLFSGPEASLRIFLAASGASCVAAIAHFEWTLALSSLSSLRIWKPGGLRKITTTGMFVTGLPGVLCDARLKLSAVGCVGKLSEDAVLAMMGPLARKIESAAAYAVLQELRARNIPLQQAEFYQESNGAGTALVGGEEIGWSALDGNYPLGELEAFVEAHRNAGEEICLLVREGHASAALAFRAEPISGVVKAAEALKALSYPLLAVSPLPKSCMARIRSEFGVDHSQGEAGTKETDELVSRLANEKLSPGWIRSGNYHPQRAVSTIALPTFEDTADLVLPHLDLPRVADALQSGKRVFRGLKISLAGIFGFECGLLLLLLSSDPRFFFARNYHFNEGALALAGIAPGLLVWALALRKPG